MEVGGFPVWYGLLWVDPTLHVSSEAQFSSTSFLVSLPNEILVHHQNLSKNLNAFAIMELRRETPFNELYPTPEALHEALQKINDIALYEVSIDEPIQIRLITPVSTEQWLVDDNYNDYRLTNPEEYQDGLKYVTVSYCWKQTQSSLDLSALPRYHITGRPGTSEPTPISCPELVFHRAMMFARSRRCPFVWIDQECIDQANPTDIQEHLKIMHHVYERSMWTVAPLSYTITDMSLAESLITYLWDDRIKYAPWRKGCEAEWDYRYTSNFQPYLRDSYELLDAIGNDKWFTRTWAFQEKLCATRLHFLVPMEEFQETSDAVQHHLIGTDLCLNLSQIQIRLAHLEVKINDTQQANNPGCHKPWSMQQKASVEHKFAVYGFPYPGWSTYPHLVYHTIQECENLVVADRLAIFGHACRLCRRHVSGLLDSPQYDLNICIMALVFANFDKGRIPPAHWVKELWNHCSVRSGGKDITSPHYMDRVLRRVRMARFPRRNRNQTLCRSELSDSK